MDQPDDHPTPRALDVPEVRQALGLYRLTATAMLAAGVGLLVMFIVLLVWSGDRSDDLERNGVRLTGEVTSYRPTRSGGTIRVGFTHLGVVRNETVRLDGASPRYERGQEVIVLVDPKDPDRVTVLGEDNLSPRVEYPMIVGLVFGMILVISGPWALVRAGRQRRLLASDRFRPVELRAAVVKVPWSRRTVLLVRDGENEHLVVVTGTVPIRPALSRLRRAAEGEVVGDLDRYAVLRVPPHGGVVSVQPPATTWGRQRWRQEFAPHPW